MNRTDALYQSFLEILREELVPAMGCTEPIAIAYSIMWKPSPTAPRTS